MKGYYRIVNTGPKSVGEKMGLLGKTQPKEYEEKGFTKIFWNPDPKYPKKVKLSNV